MNRAIDCPRCHVRMDPGFVADSTYGGYLQEKWSPGGPQTSFWRGLKVKAGETIPITTLRCPNCGYLESYATPEPDPST